MGVSYYIYVNRFMFEPEMIRFLMVVIIGSGGQAVPQTDVIILYIVENAMVMP